MDSIEQSDEYKIIGFLDEAEKGDHSYRGYQVLGDDEYLKKLREDGIDYAFPTVGFMGKDTVRNELYDKLKMLGFTIPNIIDPTAILAKDVVLLGEGIYVGKRAVIGAKSELGNMTIINTGAIIEHECEIGSFNHIAVGAVVCGECRIGNNTLVGANATVIQNISIGDRVIVGAGVTVIKDVPSDMIVYGCDKIKKLGE